MVTGIDLLEHVFLQLRDANLIGSKAEFSSKMLGRSPSYLTSMRARQRQVSNEIVMGLDAALRTKIRARNNDRDVAHRIVMRCALAEIREFLGDYPLIVLLSKAQANSKATQARGEISL